MCNLLTAEKLHKTTTIDRAIHLFALKIKFFGNYRHYIHNLP